MSNYQDTLLTFEPIAYWTISEANGTTADDIVGDQVGTYQNDVTLGVLGAIVGSPDTAITLDGSDDYLEVAHSSDFELSSGTLVIWFNPNDLSGLQTLFSKDSSGFDNGGHFTLFLNENGALELRTQDTSTSRSLTTADAVVEANSWQQVAIAWGPEGLSLYLNGTEVANDERAAFGWVGNEEPMVFGASQIFSGNQVANALGDFFGGGLDDITLFDQALSSDNIQQIYAAALVPPNTEPTAVDDTYATDEDLPLSIPAAQGVLSNDTDDDDDTLSVTEFDNQSANGGTVAVNADGSFDYTPPADFSGTDSFNYTINDGNSGIASATVNITVAASNDAPNLTGTPTGVEYVEGSAPINVGIPDLVVTDPDGSDIVNAEIEIAGAEPTEVLGIGVELPDGITSNFENGVLSLAGSAPVSVYANLLRNITYQNTDDTPPSTRLISFRVNDGESDSNTLEQSVTITDATTPPNPENSAPNLTGVPALVNYPLGDPAVNVGIDNLNVFDADGDDIVSAEIAIANAEPTEILSVDEPLPEGLTSSFENGVLRISGVAPVSAYAALLQNITYQTSALPTVTTRSISFSVSDGESTSTPLVQTVSTTEVSPDTPAKLISTATNLLGIEGGEEAQELEFRVVSQTPKSRNEFGFYWVDDIQGTINGVSPNDAGYLTQVFANSTALMSTAGDDDLEVPTTRRIAVPPGELLGFYILPNNSTDSFLAGKTSNVQLGLLSELLDGSSPLRLTAIDDTTARLSFDLDADGTFDDLQIEAQLADEKTVIVGNSLQGLTTESELYDLRDFAGVLEFTFHVWREAKYDNLIYFYKLEDESGTILDEFGNRLSPGDAGYTQAAVRQVTNQPGIGGRNGEMVSTTLTLEGGAIWAPLMVVDGTINEVLDTDPSNDPPVYFAFLGANSDGADHMQLMGDNTFGFEDLPGGGDQDFDDVVIKASIRSNGTSGLA